MHFSSVAAAVAAITTTASAFMIPPDHVLHPVQKTRPSRPNPYTSAPFHNTETKRPHSIASQLEVPSAWKIDLACPGCTWEGASSTEPQPETVLEISVNADDTNGLVINYVAAMPPHSEGAQHSTVGLVARQRRLDTGATTRDLPLDFVLERLLPHRHSEAEWSVAVTPVRFTVVGFAGRPVKVDTLEIDVVQSKDGWRVGRVKNIPFEKTPGATSCEGQTAWSYCRVKAIVRSRVVDTIRTLRETGRHAKSWAGHGCGKHTRVYHGGHHRHMRSHRWAKILHSTLRFLVIPALLGIIGGLMASAIGMLVGQIVVFVWARFGRQHHHQSRHARVMEVFVFEDEKDRLLVESEAELPSPPPRYEDLEAGKGGVVDEEKQ